MLPAAMVSVSLLVLTGSAILLGLGHRAEPRGRRRVRLRWGALLAGYAAGVVVVSAVADGLLRVGESRSSVGHGVPWTTGQWMLFAAPWTVAAVLLGLGAIMIVTAVRSPAGTRVGTPGHTIADVRRGTGQ